MTKLQCSTVFKSSLVGIIVLASGACSTTERANISAGIAQINTAIGNDLPTACALIMSADGAFQTAAAGDGIPAKDQLIEAQAMAGVAPICENPTGVNASTALAKIAAAYSAVIKARTGAK